HEREDATAAEPADLADLARRVAQAGETFHAFARAQAGAEEVIGDLLAQVQPLLLALADTRADAESAIRILTLERPEPLFTKSGTIRKLRVKGKWVEAARAAGLSKDSAEGAYA